MRCFRHSWDIGILQANAGAAGIRHTRPPLKTSRQILAAFVGNPRRLLGGIALSFIHTTSCIYESEADTPLTTIVGRWTRDPANGNRPRRDDRTHPSLQAYPQCTKFRQVRRSIQIVSMKTPEGSGDKKKNSSHPHLLWISLWTSDRHSAWALGITTVLCSRKDFGQPNNY